MISARGFSIGAAGVVWTMLAWAAFAWLGQVRELASPAAQAITISTPEPSRSRRGATPPVPWAPVDSALAPVISGEYTTRYLQILAY
jgi:hypothetical protein